MKACVIMVAIVLPVVAFAKSQNQNCKHDEKTFRCVEYVRNYDADTVTFNISNVHPIIGKKISVRVLGIDTPEIRTKNQCEKKYAKKAKEFVANMLKKAERIDIVDVQKDKYFRLLGRVHVDGRDLTKELIKKGFGYPYFGKTKLSVDWCRPLKEQRLPANK